MTQAASTEDLPSVPVLASMIFTGAWRVLSTSADDDGVSYVLARADDGSQRGVALSGRERAALTLALQGHANKHIAATLSLSTSSVATLLRRARSKLDGRVPLPLLGALCRALPGAAVGATFAASARDHASGRAG